MMTPRPTRRRFVAASAATLTLAGRTLAQPASETLRVGLMGVNGRGRSLARGFAAQPNCEVAYLCDVDSRAVDRAAVELKSHQQRPAQGVADFRRILDDPAVDALVIATPDHWHAPATIVACKAGKHVYVEKPCSHNGREGELAVAAARKFDRVVQVGTQRRSWPGIVEAIEKLRAGAIGRLLFARCWYNNRRPSIGRSQPTSAPEWLDFATWQGPAPDRPYRGNLVHYNWHWFWHWGTGEIGNNGVHGLDVARWGMNVDYPQRVTCGGGKYRHDDDQETPDTHAVTFDFDGASIAWEGLSWSPRGLEGEMFGVRFHGDAGTMVVTGGGYAIYDMHNNAKEKGTGAGGDATHLADFLDAIRTGRRAHADIEAAHKSAVLCHLGNIAYRTDRALKTDPTNGHIIDDAEAQALWRREYRPGWENQVEV